jgi:hypothetical protein
MQQSAIAIAVFTGLTWGSTGHHQQEGRMPEAIDRKFKFTATSIQSGQEFTPKNAFLFLARDPAVPAMLDTYEAKCKELGAGEEQLQAVRLLRDRVVKYQARHPKKVKVADVEPGKEAKRVCKPNRSA